MKKFLLSIFAVMLAVFSVQAEEAVFNFANLYGTETLSSVGAKTVDGITISYVKNSAQNAAAFNKDGTLRLYYGSNNGNSATFTAEAGKKITSVVVTASSANYAPDVKYSVDGANAVTGTWSNTTLTISGIKASAVTIQNVGTAQLRTKVITVTYVAEGGEPDQPETPVAPAAPTLPASCNFDSSMTVTIANIAEGATVYYTTDGSEPTEASTEYTAPFEITATTTVKAIAVNEGGPSEVVSETYTKNEPATPPAEGEVVDVLNRELTGITMNSSTYSNWSDKTVSSSAIYAGNSAGSNDAIQLRSNNSNSGVVTTKSGGKAKKVAVVWQSSTSSGRTLNVYGKNTAYSAATDLYSTSTQGTLLGTIVCGTSTELVIEGDYEYIGMRSASSAMYLTSISITWDASAGVTPVAPNAPVLPASTTFEGSMLVEITGIAADATVYYTTDESDPATSATRVEYTEPFEITATTTVKAVAVNEVGASEMATATYTLFVVEETTGYYIKVVSAPADWSGKYLIVYEEGTDAYVFNGKDEANGYVSAVTDGDVIKANSEIDAVAVTIATMEGGYSVKTADGYIYGTSNSNKLNTNASEPQLNTIEFTADGVNIEAGRYLRFNSAKGDMRFRYYNLTYGESVQLYKYVEELPLYHTLTVTEAGYATLYLGFNARIPSAVEAYTVTTVNDGWVSLTQVTGVLPANTGVIIKAPAGEYKLFNEATATADVTGNLLEGTLFNENIEEEAYVLSKLDGVVGLYRAEKNQLDGTAWLNNANKAYLPASAVPNKTAAFYGFDWDGTTGVEKVEIRNEKEEIYDLAGRRVENVTAPGIYIINGKKVLVK
ncbi:MAG: chitobiase/beta-hexosaminidase C-terminal domain-containing protein [Bacteroidaceae bacterium]|nr:chitobiase/beta-hexosaminidase C-terminal domain-containing protein [Bacteroidaceae bacterium]